MLRARKLLGIVDGSAPRATSKNARNVWDRDAACHQSYLISAIDNKLVRKLMSCRTFDQMWHRLCIVHEQKRIHMKLDAEVVDRINN
jgi:hypothetical protein